MEVPHGSSQEPDVHAVHSTGRVGTVVIDPLQGGPVLFGFAGYWLLTGIFASQLVRYFTLYRLTDPLLIRVIVIVVFGMTILYCIIVSDIVWRFFNPAPQNAGPSVSLPIWPSLAPPTIATVSSIVHFFFGWRLRMLRRKSWTIFCICAFIYSLSLTQLVSAFIVFIRFTLNSRRLAAKRSFNLTTLWLIGGLSSDLIITIALSAVLFSVRSRTTSKSTSKLLSRLISVTLETGLPTATMATFTLITFVAYSETTFDLACMLLLYIVYANALFFALNGRRELRHITPDAMTSTDIRVAIESHSMHTYSGDPEIFLEDMENQTSPMAGES